MRTLYLCGAGNPEGVRLAKRVNERQHRWDRFVILDDDVAKHGRKILEIEIEGGFALLERADPSRDEVVNLVSRTTVGRAAARAKILAFGVPFATVIHPEVDTEGVELARDVVVYQNATLGTEASVADGTVVLMGGIVGHESRVGPCCVVAPGGVINARVELGEGVYVGTNAAILPEVKVGPWATIGACSMVAQDVPAEATVMGVPGRPLMLRGKGPAARQGAKTPQENAVADEARSR